MALHQSGEDYLEAILVLQKQRGMVRSVDVARYLDVSKPSVCHAVATLRDGGFLTMDSRLTAKHIFTHVEWHMTGYTLEVAGDGPADFVWAGAEELGERAVPSAFARYSDEAKRRLGGWKED